MASRDDRYRIDLTPVAAFTFSDVFGAETCRQDDVDQKLWDFIRARCRLEEIELENPGDDLEWLIPMEVPDMTPEEEERIRQAFDPDGKGTLTLGDLEDLAERERVDFSSVASVTLGETLGPSEVTNTELFGRFNAFMAKHNLKFRLPPRT